MLIQAVARGIVQSHNGTVAGNPQWQTIIPTELADKTIGIVGLGNLGIETAKVSVSFTPHGVWMRTVRSF